MTKVELEVLYDMLRVYLEHIADIRLGNKNVMVGKTRLNLCEETAIELVNDLKIKYGGRGND